MTARIFTGESYLDPLPFPHSPPFAGPQRPALAEPSEQASVRSWCEVCNIASLAILLGRAPYDRTLRFLEIKLSHILIRGTKGDTLLEQASRLKVGWIITGLEPWTETSSVRMERLLKVCLLVGVPANKRFLKQELIVITK